MELDDIDRILSGEEEIAASSGFADSVMEAVRQEARAPAPIPFPWKRAMAGILVWIGVLAIAAVEFTRNLRMQPAQPDALANVIAGSLSSMKLLWAGGANWVVLALAVSWAALEFTRRLASR